MKRAAIRAAGIICGSLLLCSATSRQALADELPVLYEPQMQAACLVPGMRPITDAEGREVRGNRCIGGSFRAVGIPIGFGEGRLVAILNWAYHPYTPDVPTLIWRHKLETHDYQELVPPGPRAF